MMNISKKILLMIALFSFFGTMLTAQTTKKIYLSGKGKDDPVLWRFYCTSGMNSAKWTNIAVPSCWELQGFGNYNYGNDLRDSKFKGLIAHEKGLYKYQFKVPSDWKGKTVNIVFEGSMTDTKVKINRKLAGPIHQGGFTLFKYNISNLLKYGEKNLLEVTVSKMSSNESVNKGERAYDYWIFGGIYRPVYLEMKPKQHFKRIAINAEANGFFEAHAFVRGQGNATDILCQIETLEGKKIGNKFKVHINKKKPSQVLKTKLNHIKKWSPEFPNLYKANFFYKMLRVK